ncbi:protein O-linked-mannose beta-1,2-N-acetylglucosaminyltransferase 1-like [Macrobrachium rosenbergii]|uniref:protein O-linked-mannose beta-1,2-N-acetylglucosaminyltransferase 1-like n=1 Tax=Macrobrachium rosenbergii TaxID=79674 RepID=UPI0034D5C0D1
MKKSYIWLGSAICFVTYLFTLGSFIYKYNDVLSPAELEFPDLAISMRMPQTDFMDHKITHSRFHRPRQDDVDDFDVPVMEYKDYAKPPKPRHDITSGIIQSKQERNKTVQSNGGSGRETLDSAKTDAVLVDKSASVTTTEVSSALQERYDGGHNSPMATPDDGLSKTVYQERSKAATENNNTTQESKKTIHFNVEVYVSKWTLTVKLNGKTIFHEAMNGSDVKFMRKGGLYLLVLHQSKGIVMHSSRYRSFEEAADKDLLRTLKDVQPGRILVLAAMHESFSHLSDELEQYLAKQGSRIIKDMTVGDRWAWVWTKDGRTWGEGSVFSTHEYNFYLQGGALHLNAHPVVKDEHQHCSQWPSDGLWGARRTFCDAYEGYGNLCSCDDPYILPTSRQLSISTKHNIPTVVVASERPLSLHKCLDRLLEINGGNTEDILVVADGQLDGGLMEVERLVRLFGIKFQGHDAGGNNVTMRITRHYKKVFQDGFRVFPLADKLIILEEDLFVASDFYSYFEQLGPLMDRDPTLYCISAWNDLGTVSTASDPTVVLRSETMAGLGWLLTRRIYEEIIVKWPAHDKFADWDMWMRLQDQRRGRECLLPEVPRTAHFGTHGAHLTAYFQSKYFSQYAFNSQSNVTLQGLDRLSPKEYDSYLREMITGGIHLDGGAIDPCKPGLIPANQTIPRILWIMMNERADEYTLSGVLKCLGLWDLDVRGGHKYLWRLRPSGTPLFIIGWPLSPFSELKPGTTNVLRRADPKNLESEPPVYVIKNRSEDDR